MAKQEQKPRNLASKDQKKSFSATRMSISFSVNVDGKRMSMCEYWKQAKPGTQLRINGKVIAVKE